ncbi:hypothetical protein HWC26_gp162 [Aeromonas phage 2L372X]|uniref:Uncharacterized protein n=1 Tax=Aeromonas phage 2L372X TaxID=2588515 RepID=A0A5B9N3H0_9CAUD|nr:hypothetical protein HWC26_gp162 [Aeromonas phage 2L372X]QEG08414.1 hypothetical protein [Aeromonas phage 2L372X]
MVNQTQVNVVPAGVEDRELFVKEVNEIIKLREIVQSAKESEKMILSSLYEKHKELHGDNALKKGKFNKYTKAIVAEHLEAKVTEVANDSEESLSAYELVKSKLV